MQQVNGSSETVSQVSCKSRHTDCFKNVSQKNLGESEYLSYHRLYKSVIFHNHLKTE